MIKNYKFFMTPMCPDCQEIKTWLATDEVKLSGDIIDATTDDGKEISKKLMVMSVPTMVFLSDDGKEETRASDMDEIKTVLENQSLLDV